MSKASAAFTDAHWLAAAAGLAERGRPISTPNPAVGAIIVRDGLVVGRGWTRPGGRPHAEAVALAMAGDAACGATAYVTLEPCAHDSARGPHCTGGLIAAGIGRVVVGVTDPDPRTAGKGLRALADAGIETRLADDEACRTSLSGYLAQRQLGRPHVTLKLALSLDGRIALANGESRWITGPVARAHCHRERARADAILVGGGTLRADNPRLDVRLPGLEQRSPRRLVLSAAAAPDGWAALPAPTAIRDLHDVQYLFVEGGAPTAAAFLRDDLVDRLLIYRAPIIIGDGLPGVGDIGLTALSAAHGRWRMADSRALGADTLEIFHRTR